MTKQLQHHGKRSPRGKPEKTVRVGFRCTKQQRRHVMAHGGGLLMRELIDAHRVAMRGKAA